MEVQNDVSDAKLTFSDTNINWKRLDKSRFHVIGASLLTIQLGLLHPITLVKTRMQVAEGAIAHMNGLSVFRNILMADGVPGIFRGFGTSAFGSIPGRVLGLTSLEVSKEMLLGYTKDFEMHETTRIGMVNGVAGFLANILSSTYFVPLDVICQRLMVQGVTKMPTYNGPFDVIRKVLKVEGFCGLYRGFGITVLTQSPASALWWGSYATAQHLIWRSLGYDEGNAKFKPSQMEFIAVQATAGTAAGACSSVITTPVDTIKTRLQVMDNVGVGRPSVMKTTRTLLDDEGWRGLYRGFGPRFLNMSLWGTSMIVTYEFIKRLSVKRDN